MKETIERLTDTELTEWFKAIAEEIAVRKLLERWIEAHASRVAL